VPTRDQVRHMVAEFERKYPESLSDRLKWWARALGIDRIRLFMLLGLSRAEAARTTLRSLPRVVASHEDRAEMVDEMLGQLLASFDYDLSALRTTVHSSLSPAPKEKRRVTRRPAAVVPLPYVPRPRAWGGILLNEILAGGPSALPALLSYLRKAKSVDGPRGRRTV
jgi:hypothetical protein